uniref:ADP,ATP carrier protein n=2 Tax=Oxyrrhis marina TaxID=2969 RepID=A0A7S3XHS1_OXYMA
MLSALQPKAAFAAMTASSDTFLTKVVGAASQGAVGAVVGAALSSVTEPVVNKVLVERKSVASAIKEHDFEKIKRFFQTAVSTNFIKFPFFEVVNMIMANVKVAPEIRGTVTGIVFTTATLPLTNYRFRKSMNLPVEGLSTLYQAYLPTVLRDIIYGIARNRATTFMLSRNREAFKNPLSRFLTMFAIVMVACVTSAPGNELRGYVLQPPDRKKPFGEFFDPAKTARSTTIGGIIMSSSLATGALCTPYVEMLWGAVKPLFAKDPIGAVTLVLVIVDRWQRRKLSS